MPSYFLRRDLRAGDPACPASGFINVTYPQTTLPFDRDELGPRAQMAARWNDLVRVILPELARHNDWPIRLDHCFMRVCLDTALGGPWHLCVKRPAIKHLTNEQLSAAIAVGEGLIRYPETLDKLNRRSINGRRAVKTGAGAINI